MYKESGDGAPSNLEIVITLILVIGFAFQLSNQKKDFPIHILQYTG
jgi:hypothetical protein